MKKLQRFLKDRRLYSEFMREFRGGWAEKGKTYLKEYCETIPQRGLISCAFPWDYSKRGYEFWSKINQEWINETRTK
jgi:hypothetical protein